jgi:hypothetical protein
MPYRDGSAGTPTWPGPGDDDAADFLNDAIQPFLTDAKVSGGLGWIAQTPDGGAGGAGTHPNYQRMFSRGGIGTEAPPFWFFQTTAKTLWIFSGDGVDLTQQPYDQPGNPMNWPPSALFPDPAGNELGTMRAHAVTTIIGPYENFWLFGGPTGEYCHVVLKVGARQYRHFHIGMLTPLDPSLNADSFYVTSHKWAYLAPDNLYAGFAGNSQNEEHKPYDSQHKLPFRNNADNNVAFGNEIRSCGMWVYSPAYGTEGYDWWLMVGSNSLASSTNIPGRAYNTSGNPPNNPNASTKSVGDINATPDAVLFGNGSVTGYDATLGTALFASDPLFTTDGVALIPIYVSLCSTFETEIRWAPVGQVPDVFRVNMKSLDAEQEIVIGSDTYVVFPMMNKDSANTVAGEGYSGYEGLAYKKITANAV